MTRSLLLAGALSLLAAPVLADDLTIGSPAPALDEVNWIQGEPVRFGDGHTYVLDFWATWCGPCKASIPHLDELAETYRGKATVIGVAIWPSDGMVPTDEFVADKGDAMSYPVCEEIDGSMARAYMEASGSDGIPTAMIVDGEGRIAWIGHPMNPEFDGVVASVVDGTFDRDAYAAEYAEEKRKQAEMEAKMEQAQPLMGELQEAIMEEDHERRVAIADQILAIDGELFLTSAGYQRYAGLVKLDRDEAARKQADLFLGSDDPGFLNWFAWQIVDPETQFEADEQDLDVALAAAKKADTLTGSEDANVIDTLARVYCCTGDVAKAVELQRKAVALADDPDMKAALEARLAEYEAKLAG